MQTATPPAAHAPVLFDSRFIPKPTAFACGLHKVEPGPARRAPSRLDDVYERARTLCVEAEMPLPPPSDVAGPDELAAWRAGCDDAWKVVCDRYTDLEQEARFRDAAESGAFAW